MSRAATSIALQALKHRTTLTLESTISPALQNVATQLRYSSHSPMGVVSAPSRKKVTIHTIQQMYSQKEPIAMLTAHDFPSAHAADQAGMDIILVGDSLAMVSMGLDDTSEVTLDDMIMHCRSVARGARTAFIVGDMPMGSYEVNTIQVAANAIRMVKEGRVHAVKLEGGGNYMEKSIHKLVNIGIPVLGHVGLTPQRQHALGGFRVQGKTVDGAMAVLEDALRVQEAGAFAIVLEAVPADVGAFVTSKLSIPTIGIGAGNGCSGQVLVQNDMIGNFPPGRYLPKFVKRYGNVWAETTKAIQAYKADVKDRSYPATEHTYSMDPKAFAGFEDVVKKVYSANVASRTPSNDNDS